MVAVRRRLQDEGDVARIAPFEAIELDVGRLFLPRSASPEPAGD